MKNFQHHLAVYRENRRKAGFTLIELMITVAIISILAAIALPSYRQHIIRGQRAGAQAEMMEISQREQQYLMANRSYAATAADLNYTLPTSVSDYYTLSIAAPATAGVPTFTITMTPKAGTTQASDVTLTLDSSGVKLPSDKW